MDPDCPACGKDHHKRGRRQYKVCLGHRGRGGLHASWVQAVQACAASIYQAAWRKARGPTRDVAVQKEGPLLGGAMSGGGGGCWGMGWGGMGCWVENRLMVSGLTRGQ